MIVGSQPPVPFFEPFARAATEKGVVDEMFIRALRSVLSEQGMGIAAIHCTRDAMGKVDTGQPLTLPAVWVMQGE